VRKERTTGSGIRGYSRRQEPCLGSRTALRKTVEQEIAKQIVRISIRLQKMSVRTLWRGRPHPKQKKETADRLRVMDVGALTPLGTFSCTNQRKMVINLAWLTSYQGAAQDERP
jgi:hypothetical protein